MDAGSLQRAPKSPPDASRIDPISGVPSVDPATRRPPSHRTGGSKATRSGGPFHLRVSQPGKRRNPKITPPPNRSTQWLRGPWTTPTIGILTRWGDRPKARTPRTVPPKSSRPTDHSVSALPGPMGSGPKASDPPDLSAQRLLGRPDPSTGGFLGPMQPDPKTEFHKSIFKLNKYYNNINFYNGRIFLWIILLYIHKLSTLLHINEIPY